MRKFRIIILLFVVCKSVNANYSNDSLMNILNKEIDKKDIYFNEKLDRINTLKQELQHKKSIPVNKAFNLYLKLYDEYESFNYDSAFKYSEKLRVIANKMHEKSKIALAKINLGFVLLSSGMFKESIDSLMSIKIDRLNDTLKAMYFSIVARTFYDLADYDRDNYYSQKYRQLGNIYIDSACNFAVHGSLEYWADESLRRMKSNNIISAKVAFEYLIENFKLTNHQYAIATSSLGYIYSLMDNQDKAIEMLIKSSIADIKSTTKETVALRNLSEILFKKGDIKTAYKYINLALDDATFYNARHRKIEIASILPIIEGEKLNTVEKQKSILVNYSVLITVLSILVIVFALIIFRQLKRLNVAKQMIVDANFSLTETNHKLIEANKIKEEYIGYFFNITSEYIDKIEKFQRDVNRKLVTGQMEDIKTIVKNIDLKHEREELYHSFDKIFLKLFPDFVKEFNSMFHEEDRIVLKDEQLLNTDLRIFALIRMGISDNEKIAKILEYSVNTIYTYKTKIKNKSLVSNDLFEQKIMEIKTI